MKTNKNIFLVTQCLFLGNASSAQDLEAKLFNLVCKGFLQTDNFLRIKSNIGDISLLIDPLTDSSTIKYPQKPWNNYVSSFRKYRKEKQIAILNNDSIPIVPFLERDTVYIVDTLYFFSRGDFSENKRYFKRVTDEDEMSSTAKKVFLYSVIVRKNEIIFSFTFVDSDILYSIHIVDSGNVLHLLKTSAINLTSLKQHMR